MKILARNIFILMLIGMSIPALGQGKYFTRTGHTQVKSTTDIIDVVADNYQVTSFLNVNTGETSFAALIKSFEFKLDVANRIFNNQKLDVKQHPKVEFKGKILNFSDIDLTKPGTYNVSVGGTLKVWGEERWTDAAGTLTVKNDGTILGNSSFLLTLEEKSVKTIDDLMKEHVPKIVQVDSKDLGISRDIYIKVNLTYKEM